MCSFTPAPVYKPSRKYMSSEHHLFLIRLNVETGSSNQPWAFLPTLLFFTLSNQQEQRDASLASISSQAL